MNIINYFKKFGDYIDSIRKPKYNFKKILINYVNNKKIKVLEIGSSDRPMINIQDHDIILHGLDPDTRLKEYKGDGVFHKFFNSSIQNINLNEKYDFIYCNMVLEHVENNDLVSEKVRLLLKKGGFFITNQPSNFHPFSIINRIVPTNFARILIKYLQPWSKLGIKSGYKAYYHKTNFPELNKLYKKNNFIVNDFEIDYNGSDYFKFFPPLFLIIVLYEELVRYLDIKLLCARFWVLYQKQ
tara:strand:- start:24213 stop:24935 length:723 start_codon:yes stop_codon:yes gene_type:complete